VGSIGVLSPSNVEVGVATENGRSYFAITSLLRRARIPYVDVLLRDYTHSASTRSSIFLSHYSSKRLKLIITTRKERLQIVGNQIICIEDLGDDLGLAKQKLLSILHQFKETDRFVIGIDPGERNGLAAFMNHVEIDTAVLGSLDETVSRTCRLLDNAPRMRKFVKIGSGIPQLAEVIACKIASKYGPGEIRIQLVDERGTSSLYQNGKTSYGTRDQRSAKLIAFREGQDYLRAPAISN
jgi:hypothetical protein